MIEALQNKDRPVRDVPVIIIVFLLLALLMQLSWHSQQAVATASAEELPLPMSAQSYQLMSLGEPIAMSKVLNLWLQAFDNQPGLSLSFHQLDYKRITLWLDTILQLDPRGSYPMLAAARIYGSISDPMKKRIMMDYIYDKFEQDPDQHWRWLAHAVITTKHELKDMPLALKYAHALADRTTADKVPYWARDMRIIVLEDMGEVEAARILVGALIDSGEITDRRELLFLTEKIQQLEEKMSK